MAIEKFLGKISEVKFGKGGYQDACIGITFNFEGKNIGVNDFWGYWSIKCDKGCQWTNDDRIKYLGEVVMRIHKILVEAKVDNVEQLKGIPVEVIFEGNCLKSWRILTEVL